MQTLGFQLYADGFVEQVGPDQSDLRQIKSWNDQERRCSIVVYVDDDVMEDDVAALLCRFLGTYFPELLD